MKKQIILLSFLLILFAAEGNLLATQETTRKEIGFSFGWTFGRNPGIMKSLGWFFIPRFVEFDINLAIMEDVFALSGNLSLHLPLGPIVPFITGGGGFSPTGPTVRNLGGGLKFRLSKKTGLLAEYRHFYYSIPRAKTRYLGAGITYSF